MIPPSQKILMEGDAPPSGGALEHNGLWVWKLYYLVNTVLTFEYLRISPPSSRPISSREDAGYPSSLKLLNGHVNIFTLALTRKSWLKSFRLSMRVGSESNSEIQNNLLLSIAIFDFCDVAKYGNIPVFLSKKIRENTGNTGKYGNIPVFFNIIKIKNGDFQ